MTNETRTLLKGTVFAVFIFLVGFVATVWSVYE